MRLLNPLNCNLHHTLNLIRGLAVLLVLFSHLDNYRIFILWPFSFQPLQYLIGQLGVHLFFLLSGFLIWASAKQSLGQPRGLLIYFVNRVTRIYPNYLICILFLALTAHLFLGSRAPEISFYTIFRHLFFLQSFEPDVSAKLNVPFWSLTYEFMFYLLVPVLFFFRPSHWILFISIPITQILFIYIDDLHAFSNFWCLFAIGILIQEYRKVINKFVCGLLLLLCLLSIEFVKVKLLEFLFAAILFNTLLNFEFKRMMFKPLASLGVISYSVYVWHYALIHLISPYIKNVHVLIAPIKPWLPFGFALEAFYLIVFILFFSTISYWLIEKPSMTLLRKRLTQFATADSKG